jgi:twitching motility protein PilT
VAVDVNQLFQSIIKAGISDVHMKAGAAPMVRLHGNLVTSGYNKLTNQHIEELANALMTPDQRKAFAQERELDMSYEVPGLARFRVNIYRQRGTVALSLRVAPLSIRPLEELNLPSETFRKICANTRGLVLVSGITGAGKTTTLNALIDHINKTYSYNVVTIEDPIEYFHADNKCSIAQREIGHDTESFAKAMKHLLRQDPDVVVLGEMRDAESIQAGIMAAETGHLVFGTIHTMNASQTMDRLVESYEAEEQAGARARVANVLRAVVSQRLIESADGQARFPATEILVVTSLVQKLLVEGKTAEIVKAMEQGKYYGMHTFDQDLLRLYTEKKVSKDAALEASTTPDDLTVKISTAGIEVLGG